MACNCNPLPVLNPPSIQQCCQQLPPYAADVFPVIQECDFSSGSIFPYTLVPMSANVSNGTSYDPYYGEQVFFSEDQPNPQNEQVGPGSIYPLGFLPSVFATLYQRTSIWSFTSNASLSGIDSNGNPYLMQNKNSVSIQVPPLTCSQEPIAYSDSNFQISLFDGSPVGGDWAYLYNGLIYPAINVNLLFYPGYTGPWALSTAFGFTDYNDCLKLWHGPGIYSSKASTNAFMIFDEDGHHDAIVARCDNGSSSQIHQGGIDIEFN
jgi:hypothetical protein